MSWKLAALLVGVLIFASGDRAIVAAQGTGEVENAVEITTRDEKGNVLDGGCYAIESQSAEVSDSELRDFYLVYNIFGYGNSTSASIAFPGMGLQIDGVHYTPYIWFQLDQLKREELLRQYYGEESIELLTDYEDERDRLGIAPVVCDGDIRTGYFETALFDSNTAPGIISVELPVDSYTIQEVLPPFAISPTKAFRYVSEERSETNVTYETGVGGDQAEVLQQRVSELEQIIADQEEIISALTESVAPSSSSVMPPPLEPGVDANSWSGLGAWSNLPSDKTLTLICNWQEVMNGQLHLQCGWMPYPYP